MLFDIFQSVIVPRPVARTLRASALVTHCSWSLWRALGRVQRDAKRREDLLSTYAPFLLILLLVVWTGLLVLGYGLMFYGLRAHLVPAPELGGALYFAGTTLITIGFGDIVPKGAPARFLAVVTGATGFAVVAVVTSYLFSIFAAFQAREVFVLRLGALAGSPASGVEILEIATSFEARADLGELFMRGQNWAATVLETHLAYPILAYFRSNHDYVSWIATLGAVLDASILLISTIADEQHGQARLMYRVGSHLVSDLTKYFGLPNDEAVGIDRDEFETVRGRLAQAGYHVNDGESAWREFSALRATYSTPLNTLAKFWQIPPAQWIGDRSNPKLNAHVPLRKV